MICLVTDRRRLSSGPDAIERLVDLVAAAAHAGVDLIQVRERDLEAGELAALVWRCVQAVEDTGARVLVNDRADVALAAGAHGVHLRADSISAGAARSLLPSSATVGRSVHSAGEVSAVCRAGGVDYLIFGTLFETSSKDAGHRLATLPELTDACREATGAVPEGAATSGGRGVPVLAIGGMTTQRAALVRRAGASGIAGIGLFIPPAGCAVGGYVQTVVSDLRRTFDTCEAVS